MANQYRSRGDNSRFKKILPEENQPYVDKIIDFLIEQRLLLRGKNQAQDDGLDINSENVKLIRHVYVPKGTFVLWNLLGRSSVLLELCTDDIYIDYQEEILERQNFSMFDQKTFERCISFIDRMEQIENNIRTAAHNKGLYTNVIDLIDSDFIVKHLLTGLKTSRNAYFKENNEYKIRLDAMEARIDQKQQLLNQ